MATPSQRARLGASWAACPDKPAFHLLPVSGWVNDPNGLVWDARTARFHAFYQHVASSPAWAWGHLAWGHASSADLATWTHEPVALAPSPGGPDGAGCWSGCCVPGVPGTPPFTLLFTGVSLRDGPHARDPAACHPHCPPVPPAADLGLEQHECQLAAVLVDAGDLHLRAWQKRAAPIIPHAPPVVPGAVAGQGWAGFRDPFVFQRWGGEDRPWRLVVGSGRKGGRGCLLGYASTNPDPGGAGWVFEGVSCGGEGVVVGGVEMEWVGSRLSPPSLDAIDVGEMWECPFIARLLSSGGDGGSGTSRAFTLVCVSPYPRRGPSSGAAGAGAGGGWRPANPPIFWLCEGEEGEEGVGLDLAAAAVGPLRLDLGDTLYAPTMAAGGGPHGSVMMGWCHELRGLCGEGAGPPALAPARDYAGCLTLARALSVRVGADGRPRLHQEPVAGVASLRMVLTAEPPPAAWALGTRLQPGGRPLPVPGAAGDAVDFELVFEKPAAGTSACCTGLWLRPGLVAAGDAPPGTATPTAVALLAHWSTGRLEVAHFTALTRSGCPDMGAVVRRVGGVCEGVVGGRVRLRVVVDHSVVEVFAGSGEALTTRVYGSGASNATSPAAPRWSVFSLGDSPAPVPEAAGWAMGVGWGKV